jgi:hypothetical protein
MSLIYINPYAFGAALDPDAAAYIAAVEGPSADNQALEPAVVTAINDFVVGCKADGIWSAIKASCILAGARTLSGALIPLAGTAPTNNNFVSGDYDRKTGLNGNGTTKWLNSNRNNNVDPQNSFHMCCYVSTVSAATAVYMGAGPATNESGASNFGRSGTMFTRNRTSGATSVTVVTTGLMGNSRDNSSTYTNRFGGISTTATVASQTPNNNLIGVFSATNGAIPAAGRFAFYSIGESLAIALLDSRVTTLINDFAAAIP